MAGFANIKPKKDLYEALPQNKKEKVDFTETLAISIPQNKDLALKQGNLSQALENLLALEKQTRQAADLPATSEVAIAIVQLCRECKDWTALNSHITLLVKRRGQLKQVVTKVVQESMKYLDDTPDMDTKLQLIHTLRAVSEGKIHTELERARLTRTLAKIKEDEGKIGEAADILGDVQVETYGQMERAEKVEYILEQVRLCLDNKDFIRGGIMAKKINQKHFSEGQLQDLKLRYHNLLNRHHFHSDDYLELAKSYFAIYETPKVQEDPVQWKEALRDVIIFLVLAKHSNDQWDMLNRVAEDKKLEQVPEWRNLLLFFKSQELTRWPLLSETYTPLLAPHPAFQGEDREKRLQALHSRIVQHNIRVIAKYYHRITMPRLATLLDLDGEKTEEYLCEMVTDKHIVAKIDRIAGIVVFAERQNPNDTLNTWAHDITELLGKVEKTCHIIHKEQMVNAAKPKPKTAAS